MWHHAQQITPNPWIFDKDLPPNTSWQFDSRPGRLEAQKCQPIFSKTRCGEAARSEIADELTVDTNDLAHCCFCPEMCRDAKKLLLPAGLQKKKKVAAVVGSRRRSWSREDVEGRAVQGFWLMLTFGLIIWRGSCSCPENQHWDPRKVVAAPWLLNGT